LEVIALSAIAQSTDPIGARRLSQIFRSHNVQVAEATGGRFLRSLDVSGLTLKSRKLGRVLTERGRQRLEDLQSRMQSFECSSRVVAAADVGTLDELLDLLRVRRAVDAEAARLAAMRATTREIRQLSTMAQIQTDCTGSCDRLERSHSFHFLLADASHNRMLSAMTALLLDPTNDKLAILLDQISVKFGAITDMTCDHHRIAAALVRRDREEAERLARQHVDKMIAVVMRHRGSGTASASKTGKKTPDDSYPRNKCRKVTSCGARNARLASKVE
jgi:GntR family transcriptional repressor for pyruvate dehydrogenase complex